MKRNFLFVLVMMLCAGGFAQDYWSDTKSAGTIPESDRQIVPDRFRLLSLKTDELKKWLATAPDEFTEAAKTKRVIISLPLPNGGLSRFYVLRSSIMEKPLADQFPEIQTYSCQGIDDPYASARIDFTLKGFHGMVISPSGHYFIDPYAKSTTALYISYYKRDFTTKKNFTEEAVIQSPEQGQNRSSQNNSGNTTNSSNSTPANRSNGTQLRTYRVAIAATVEYSTYHGSTISLVLSAQVTTLNRVVAVYRTELAISMTLVANNTSIIYATPTYTVNNDPYTNSSGSNMLTENQTTLNSKIGSSSYDIGHVFSTGGGGVAYLQSVCASNKAGGVTGSSSPVGDPFDIDYVAHEMGHQFGGNHTFNGNTGSCSGGNRNASTAYEPGSGSTIMAYAGICAPQDLQPHSDPYFHTINFDEIITNVTTGIASGCGTITSTGNNPPVATVAATTYNLPKSTPFILKGSGSDPDGDALTYYWEQMNTGAASAPNSPTTGPRFRSFVPTISSSRIIPDYDSLLKNITRTGEVLVTGTQTVKFRLTVRDNRATAGGVAYDANYTTLSFTTAAGPFTVTTAPANWIPSSTQTVTWNVNGTNTSPVSCASVNILLSDDGGITFPYTLASATANDGSESITVPNINTTSARLKVEAVGNIFFAISAADFPISNPVNGTFGSIGSGTGSNTSTTYPAPYGSYYGGAKHQLLYTAAELLAAGFTPGLIRQFGFNISALVNDTLTGFTIKMGNTLSANLSGGWESNLTTVYAPALYRPLATGWNMHTLTTPFLWDGISNIVVETCFNNNNGGKASHSGIVLTNTLLTGMCRYYRMDNSATVCSFTGTPSGTEANRSNARFFVVPTPLAGALNLLFTNTTSSSVTFSWLNGSGAKRIVVVCPASATLNNPVNLTDYNANTVYGSGSNLGNNNYVVYNGTGSAVTVTGLNANITYKFRVFEYNGVAGDNNYLVTGSGSNQSTLPVTYLSFTARKVQDEVLLNWTTASELNNDHFTIQRLPAENSPEPAWENAGNVKGAGTSSITHAYRFTDPLSDALRSAGLYYRLKQTDFDGQFHYSDLVFVPGSANEEHTVQLVPNPSNGIFTISFGMDHGFTSLKIFDSMGREIKQVPVTEREITIDLSAPGKGLYTVMISGSKQTVTKKVVVR